MPHAKESVTAAEIIRNFGYWQQQALLNPLTVTHHGRARVLLISADEYDRLKQAAGSTETRPVGAEGPSIKLNAIMDNMAEGYILLDKDLKIAEINRIAEAYYGVERTGIHGRELGDLFPEETCAFILDWVLRVQRSGEIATFETSSSVYPDRKISARVFQVRDQIGILFLNITEQERLRDQAAEWRACWDVMSQHNSVSLSKLDGRGRVVSSDAEFATFTGFSAQELAHVKIFDIVAPSHRKRLQNAFEEVMQNRQTVHLDVQVMVKNGSVRNVHIALSPLTRDFVAHAAVMLMADAAENLEVEARAA